MDYGCGESGRGEREGAKEEGEWEFCMGEGGGVVGGKDGMVSS